VFNATALSCTDISQGKLFIIELNIHS
jgi:hypothetical protein